MINLETKYLGLNLKNPIIVSSSGLTNSVEKIKKLEEFGAGAVVLKSLFEEQINHEAGRLLTGSNYPEAEDYIMNYTKSNSVDEYLDLIEQAKKSVNIPVIASINCISVNEWISFAKRIEEAGADALELNVFMLPTDKHANTSDIEQLYIQLVTQVREKISIPVSIKLGSGFTNMLGILNKIEGAGAAGVVMFNRFYQPDIDIESLKLISSEVFSKPYDIRYTLRWIGLASSALKKMDLAASTGVHDGAAAIKLLLAGANAVQVCSVLYKNGPEYIQEILREITVWMERKGYNTIDSFTGKLNYDTIPDPTIYERSQFMKYFSNIQ